MYILRIYSRLKIYLQLLLLGQKKKICQQFMKRRERFAWNGLVMFKVKQLMYKWERVKIFFFKQKKE